VAVTWSCSPRIPANHFNETVNIPHLEFVEAFSFGFRLDMLQPRRTGRDRIDVVFHAHDDHAWLTAALDNESFIFALRVS
jgi:hypothetical protein